MDDDPHVRNLLTEVLGADYEVQTADDGPSGVDRAISFLPDIVLLDVDMPGFDGMEVLKRLDAKAETRHIPVLILTVTRFNTRSKAEFEEWTSVKAFMQKPFDVEELRSRIARCLPDPPTE